MRLAPKTRLAIPLILLAAVPSLTSAQIPDKFTNLQVLPKETTRQDLIMRMRGFAGGLGVRCNFCHVGKNAETLEGFDFASDDKEEKKVARAMMRMVQEINERLLPATGRKDLHQVSCITCHRGSTIPQTLGEMLLETARKDGAEAAIKQYRDLREKHSGEGMYDFSGRSLSPVAEMLLREKKDLEGALAVARLNAEVHPTEPNAHILVGQVCVSKGDLDCALASFGKAAELDPKNAWVQKQIESVKAQKAAPKSP